jgi:A/G-specific adenine glycosylase
MGTPLPEIQGRLFLIWNGVEAADMVAKLGDKDLADFRQLIYSHYRLYGRKFPWRETTDPYAIMVSEIMLQQTQAERVVKKYPEFLAAYPDFRALHEAPFKEVLAAWQGMGYNRRAKALKEIAAVVIREKEGVLPDNPKDLQALPMIGYATACSISAFAFNKPVVFIETNIRRVFLHFFFPVIDGVPDRDIYPMVRETLDRSNPRDWYNALMDYGAKLKRELPNPNRRSRHYTVQDSFENSDRQIRGKILKLLTERGEVALAMVAELIKFPEKRVMYCIESLKQEGFLCSDSGKLRIEDSSR